jgi:glutamate-5-semialdehyde dehydrogenase
MSPEYIANLKAIKKSWIRLRQLDSAKKNECLLKLADLILEKQSDILKANTLDLKNNSEHPLAYLDRLTLNPDRIRAMAQSLTSVAALLDPVGEIVEQKALQNGLLLKRTRAPLGVILMIFESRPNVATEAFSMAFKSGNSIILRGGRESQNSVGVLYQLMKEALRLTGLDENFFWGLTNYDRTLVDELLKQKEFIDIVIPRGGEKLIAHVQAESLMPIIKNDRGLCHTYVHFDADLEMAEKIIINAKASRPSVCNSLESILVHRDIAPKLFNSMIPRMKKYQMFFYACPESFEILKSLVSKDELNLATDVNFATEYLDFKMNIKIVGDLDEALEHIEKFGSRHSEAIVTSNRSTAQKFQNQIDAAAVYWNASTRFTDGFEFGLGGEIGISTQKLHVRGPVGLKELTSTRWIIDGAGQIR